MDGDQLIKSLDRIYFQDEENFNLDHITDQLPDPDALTSEYLLDYKGKLERMLAIVTRKVSELILSHQPTYIDELQRIADLQNSITESIRACSSGRKCIKFIKDSTTNGLTVIEHHQKRELLANFLDSLTIISELRKSVIEIRSLIDSQEDFPRAIQMCKDGKAMLEPHSQFKCVNDLLSKLNDTMELIGERMDNVLSQMFTSYDPEIYLKLKTAYAMMDRGEIAVGQLLMHFNVYHNSSVDELRMFLENELWEVLPVKGDFTLVQLKEFSFLRESISSSNIAHISRNLKLKGDNLREDLFADPENEDVTSTGQENSKKHFSFFDNHEALPMDRISLSSESDLESDLEKDFVDEDEPPSVREGRENNTFCSESADRHQDLSAPNTTRLLKSSGPVLTNSSLNVLRLTGRYIQMMTVLTPIAYEILMKVYKLLDVYAIFVFRKFGPNNDKQITEVIASLRESLLSPGGIQSNTIEQAGQIIFGPEKESGTSTGLEEDTSKVPLDPKKTVAIKSLVFLVNQFWNLQEYLETLISVEQRIELREQFSQKSHSVIPDFLKARAELGDLDTRFCPG